MTSAEGTSEGTFTEEERARQRKEREREASRRSRAKKRGEISALLETNKRLEKENEELRVELQRARELLAAASISSVSSPAAAPAAGGPSPAAPPVAPEAVLDFQRRWQAGRAHSNAAFAKLRAGATAEELRPEIDQINACEIGFLQSFFGWLQDAVSTLEAAAAKVGHSWLLSNMLRLQADEEGAGSPPNFGRQAPEARALASEALAALCMDRRQKEQTAALIARNAHVIAADREICTALRHVARELRSAAARVEREYPSSCALYQHLVGHLDPLQFARYIYWLNGDEAAPGRGPVVVEYAFVETGDGVPTDLVARVLAGPGPAMAQVALAPIPARRSISNRGATVAAPPPASAPQHSAGPPLPPLSSASPWNPFVQPSVPPRSLRTSEEGERGVCRREKRSRALSPRSSSSGTSPTPLVIRGGPPTPPSSSQSDVGTPLTAEHAAQPLDMTSLHVFIRDVVAREVEHAQMRGAPPGLAADLPLGLGLGPGPPFPEGPEPPAGLADLVSPSFFSPSPGSGLGPGRGGTDPSWLLGGCEGVGSPLQLESS